MSRLRNERICAKAGYNRNKDVTTNGKKRQNTTTWKKYSPAKINQLEQKGQKTKQESEFKEKTLGFPSARRLRVTEHGTQREEISTLQDELLNANEN